MMQHKTNMARTEQNRTEQATTHTAFVNLNES